MSDRNEVKPEVKKIVLDLGDKEIDLTPYQAKMLARILGEMFIINAKPYPVYIERPWIWPFDRPYDWTYTYNDTVAGTASFSSGDGVMTLALNMPDQSAWSKPIEDGLPENVSGDPYHADL